MVLQIGRHRELAAVQRCVADTGNTRTRNDFQRDEIARRASDDDFGGDDLAILRRPAFATPHLKYSRPQCSRPLLPLKIRISVARRGTTFGRPSNRARILPIWTNSIPIGFSPPIPPREPSRANLYQLVKDLPIISPHGHTDPKWFADNVPVRRSGQPAADARIIMFSACSTARASSSRNSASRASTAAPPSAIRARSGALFAAHYYLFRGTPTRMWFDWVLSSIFDAPIPLTPENADATYDRIAERLQKPDFRPRALVRALQHRGARDHRVAARRSHASRHHPQERLAWARDHRLPARQRGRSGHARLSRQPQEIQRAHR